MVWKNYFLIIRGFIIAPRSFNCLTPTPDSSSYELTIPKFDANSPQYFTWIERDLGQCVLALLKHYKDDSAHILGETFYAVSDKMSYTDYANVIEKGSVLLSARIILDSHSWCSGRKARSFRERCNLWIGGEVYQFCHVFNIVHIREFIQEMDEMVCVRVVK